MRKTLLTGCTSLALMATGMTAFAEPATGGSHDQSVVPDTTITELGPAMEAVNLRGGTFGYEDGRPVAYIPSNGEPATFTVVDAVTGEALYAEEFEGYTMLSAASVSPDGSVYFTGSNPTPGAGFRYLPDERRVEHLGDNLGGESWLVDSAVDEHGVVYFSTNPTGKLLSYDPATGEHRDYGQVIEGVTYGYTVEVVGDEVWVGTGTVPHIIAVDPVSGDKREIPLPEDHLENTDYVLNLQVEGDLVFAGLSPRGKYETLVLDRTTEEFLAVIPAVGPGGLTPAVDGVVYHFDADFDLVGFDTETLERVETQFSDSEIPAVLEGANVYALDVLELGIDGFPGESVVGTINTGEMWAYNPATGEARILTPDVLAAASNIIGMGIGPDGNVWTGAKVGPNLLGILDAETWERTQVEGPAQAEGIGAFDDMLVVGAYSGAELFAGTLDDEWDWGTNPEKLFALGRGGPYHQDRIWTMANLGEEMALGTIPEPGYTGGKVVFTDPRTGEYEMLEDFLEGHSFVSMLEHDGVLYGGTSIHGGSSTAPVVDDAMLYALDADTREVLWEVTPLAGAETLGGLSIGPDGDLWAVAEQGSVVRVDDETGDVVSVTEIIPAAEVESPHPWSMYSSLVYDEANDGFYGSVGWKMFFLDRETLDFGFLREDHQTFRLIQAPNGSIFCASKTELCAVEPAGAEDPGDDPTEDPSPTPTPDPDPTTPPPDKGGKRPGLPSTGV